MTGLPSMGKAEAITAAWASRVADSTALVAAAAEICSESVSDQISLLLLSSAEAASDSELTRRQSNECAPPSFKLSQGHVITCGHCGTAAMLRSHGLACLTAPAARAPASLGDITAGAVPGGAGPFRQRCRRSAAVAARAASRSCAIHMNGASTAASGPPSAITCQRHTAHQSACCRHCSRLRAAAA